MTTEILSIKDDKDLVIKVMNVWLNDNEAYKSDFIIVDVKQVNDSLALVFKNETDLDVTLRDSLTGQMCKELGLSFVSPLDL
jgi:hypothetical protein